MTVDRAAQRGFVFDEGWRLLRDGYYDPALHGCDWPAARERYRPWALAAPSYRDFQDVFRLMMGEINSSHMGLWGGPGDPALGEGLRAQAGELGVLFAARDNGPGLLVAHVVPHSPAAREESRLAPGERILAVNGVPRSRRRPTSRGCSTARSTSRSGCDVSRRRRQAAHADDPPDRLPRLPRAPLRRGDRGPAGAGARAHRRNASPTSTCAGMSEESLDLFERDLYAEAHGRDALILDVRDNGGGWTTDLLLTSLIAADHATTISRGSGPGYPSERRLLYAWTKPIAVLCDEYSFSNAEIFSWSIRALKRGPLVGQQTNGGVISTGGTRSARRLVPASAGTHLVLEARRLGGGRDRLPARHRGRGPAGRSGARHRPAARARRSRRRCGRQVTK